MSVRASYLIMAAALILGGRSAQAQTSGDGYLFGEPAARLNFRAGFAAARARSELFDQVTSDLTLDRGSFGGPFVGAELAFRLSPQVDLAFDADYAWAKHGSEYRHFVDNNNRPIEQTTQFQRVPITANVRAYLTPRGRSIGRLAWIPSSIVPWVGAGGGATWYRFRQEGDFVNFQTNGVFTSTLESSGWGKALQAMAGVDVTLTPSIALTGDVRYLWSDAALDSRTFVGFQNHIDLSGAFALIGFTFRL